MEYAEILEKLKALSNPKAAEGMAGYGITPASTYGVSLPNLRKMAKEIGTDHKLSQQLWNFSTRETRILASIIADPKLATEEQMEGWAKDFDYWEICDQCCLNLFWRTGFARQKAVEWSSDDREFVKRAGFALMACLAFKNKSADDEQFEEFFPLIEREAADNRAYVKKAVNWALRQIGKRNLSLNAKAIKIAEEIQRTDSRSARWVAADAIRELKSEAVQKRLRVQKS